MPLFLGYPPGVSQYKYGTVTTPILGGTIVSLSQAPAAGLWTITVQTHVWGTGASSVENNNMQLTGTGGSAVTLPVDGGTGTNVSVISFNFLMDGAHTPMVTTPGTASTNTTYSALLIATPSQW